MHAKPRTLVLALLVGCGAEQPKPAAPVAPAAPPAADAAVAAAETADAGSGAGTALVSIGSAGSKKADRRTGSADWKSCHAGFKPGSDPAADVVKLAQGCAATTKMRAVGDVLKGSQKASDVPQTFKQRFEAKHCYRVYAESAGTITDLDLVIKDGAGAIAAEDSTDDRDPVALEDGAVCFSEADEGTIVVSVGGGQGAYALQVWSD